MIIPRIKLLSPTSKVPTKAYIGDAGFDVYSNIPDLWLGPGERFKIPLGFAIEIPTGYVGVISEKSGMANNAGVITIGNIIDSGYRGECHAILFNSSDRAVRINNSMKVAQLLIHPCYTERNLEIVDELSEADRGDRGFGSSGGV